ncbi:hypothetical protein EDB84DRAFT_1566534 [Lactarius hengduanensis]|nr:hypothetical protein EDB84DRAFT_1566534 [Lactarius hengduanensis]
MIIRGLRQTSGKVHFFYLRLVTPSHALVGLVVALSAPTMPSVPIHRKLLDDLDDVDRSFKRARLQKYLEDSGVAIAPGSSADPDSDPELSSVSSLSSISSIASDDDD